MNIVYLLRERLLHRTGGQVLNINCKHLLQYHSTRKLYNQLILYPQEIIPIFDTVANDEYVVISGGDADGNKYLFYVYDVSSEYSNQKNRAHRTNYVKNSNSNIWINDFKAYAKFGSSKH